ncbi:MAG: protein-tyrosine phosphatase family protein, partial [Woeseia sp.]
MKFHTVIDSGSGSLAIMPHPKSDGPLDSTIELLSKSCIDTVISLLTLTEEQELDLTDERAAVIQHGMQFRSFPIRDKGVPLDLPAFCELAADISRLIEQKHRVVLHCWAGIGRSGLLAATILVRMG